MKNLLAKEMSFTELDNFMIKKGYYSVFEDGCTKEIKESANVIYTSTKTNEAEISIKFEITQDSGEDEIEESFYLKAINITKI